MDSGVTSSDGYKKYGSEVELVPKMNEPPASHSFKDYQCLITARSSEPKHHKYSFQAHASGN